MHIDVLSLFPDYIEGPLRESILKRAIQHNILSVASVDIRSFSSRNDGRVDDRPFGGGPGMVMMADPVVKAIRSRRTPQSRVIYLTPQGMPLSPKLARQLAQESHLILLCGHYEGIDQRAIETDVDQEVSIGDYVLTNGCLAALVVIDAVARFIPGVLGNASAAGEDSFEDGIFDCPHYTQPRVFEGHKVPEVLFSGNHDAIALWRRNQAMAKTVMCRPDLIADRYLTDSSIHLVEYSPHFDEAVQWYTHVFGVAPAMGAQEAMFSMKGFSFTLLRTCESGPSLTSCISIVVPEDQLQSAVLWCRRRKNGFIDQQPREGRAVTATLKDPDGRIIKII
jgi:tRNA (guanine37-N1)-methyltransferase